MTKFLAAACRVHHLLLLLCGDQAPEDYSFVFVVSFARVFDLAQGHWMIIVDLIF